jgi:hypothetical protein
MERQALSALFAKLPVRVLWRLSKTEIPNQAAIDELHLANNTKAKPSCAILLKTETPTIPQLYIDNTGSPLTLSSECSPLRLRPCDFRWQNGCLRMMCWATPARGHFLRMLASTASTRHATSQTPPSLLQAPCHSVTATAAMQFLVFLNPALSVLSCAVALQAAYHGVPMVALPFLGDQPEIADKVVGRVRMLNSNHWTSVPHPRKITAAPLWQPCWLLPVSTSALICPQPVKQARYLSCCRHLSQSPVCCRG